jgi:hypothetical protein
MTLQEELAAKRAELDALGAKVVYKDQSWFWKALNVVMIIITFGKMRDFGTQFTTTIGKTIAVPPQARTWDDLAWLETLTHEGTHVLQFKKYTPVLFGLAYLLCFFPIGLAYVRYRAERRAYVNGFTALLKYRPDLRPALVAHGVAQMTGSNYLYAWPFKKSVTAWFEANIPKVAI